MRKRKSIISFFVLVLLTFVFSTFSQTKTIPYQQLATSTGSLSGSGIFFGATMTTSSITVTFEGPSDRWIALGLGTAMPSTDVLIFSNGVSSSTHTLGWYDYYNSSYSSSGVTIDVAQNWNIISNNVTSSQRTVVATRTLSTGDANDAVINFTSSALSLVWAKGSSADYTIAYHGSSNRANGIALTWLSPPTASFVSSSSTICAGSSITFSNVSTGGLTSYTWTFGGGNPATSTSTNPVVTYSVPGTYSVVLTASNAIGTDTYTQLNFITVTSTITPSIVINQISGANPICSGAAANYSAFTVNGGTSPFYQWKVNGTNVGTNSSTYSTTSLTNNSSVTCVLISNAVCPSPTLITSSAITMTVNSISPASVSIALSSGNNPLCVGSTLTFTANSVNGGSTPSYQWKINGSPVGTNSSSFTTNTLSNNNLVTCDLSSNASCASSTFAVSSGITMSVSSILSPSVSVNVGSGNNPLCAGDLLVFTVTPSNGGVNPFYQWKVNGINVGGNTPSYSTNTLSNSQIVTCVMISALSCSSPSFATSSALTLTVNPIPNPPFITPSGTIGLCFGASVLLASSATVGNFWSNNSTTQSISVVSPGNYSVTQMLNGCTSPPSALVTVTANPQPTAIISSPNSPLCVSASPYTLQGSPIGGVYSGNGVTGNVFVPALSLLGNNLITYSFTDANNCTDTASTNIFVSDCLFILNQGQVEESIVVFPNPTSGLFKVNSTNEKIIAIIISDATGKIIFKKYYVNETKAEINISKEPQGIYFVVVFFENNTKQLLISKED